MEHQFILQGNIPSKKNSKIFNTKSKKLFPSKAYSIWHEIASIQIQDQYSNKPPLTNIKSVSITFVRVNKRKFDLTNKVESVMDLLVDVGVIHDDNLDEIPKVIIDWIWINSLDIGWEDVTGGCVIKIDR